VIQMTNEQAIEILRDTPIDIRSTREDDIHTLYATAQNMAIEALEVGHAQCNDCHYRYHWMTQRMNGQNGGATG